MLLADIAPGVAALMGAVAGSLASVATTVLALRSERSRLTRQQVHERELAQDERQSQRLALSESYLAATLLELQMALQQLMRATHAILHHDIQAQDSGLPFGRSSVDPHWDLAMQRAIVAVQLLAERVQDDTVRDAAMAVIPACTFVHTRPSEPEAELAADEARMTFTKASNLIGETLRSLPPPPTYQPIVTTYDIEP